MENIKELPKYKNKVQQNKFIFIILGILITVSFQQCVSNVSCHNYYDLETEVDSSFFNANITYYNEDDSITFHLNKIYFQNNNSSTESLTHVSDCDNGFDVQYISNNIEKKYNGFWLDFYLDGSDKYYRFSLDSLFLTTKYSSINELDLIVKSSNKEYFFKTLKIKNGKVESFVDWNDKEWKTVYNKISN